MIEFYKDYCIQCSAGGLLIESMSILVTHKDFDGEEDQRYFYARDVEQAKQLIDELEED